MRTYFGAHFCFSPFITGALVLDLTWPFSQLLRGLWRGVSRHKAHRQLMRKAASPISTGPPEVGDGRSEGEEADLPIDAAREHGTACGGGGHSGGDGVVAALVERRGAGGEAVRGQAGGAVLP